MLSAQEAQGVRVHAWLCSELAHRGSVWKAVVQFPSIKEPHAASHLCPFPLAEQAWVEGLLEMALIIKDTKVFS